MVFKLSKKKFTEQKYLSKKGLLLPKGRITSVMPKSFLVRRAHKVETLKDTIDFAVDNDIFRASSKPCSQHLICNCSASDNISSCGGDSLVSPLYDANSYSRYIRGLNEDMMELVNDNNTDENNNNNNIDPKINQTEGSEEEVEITTCPKHNETFFSNELTNFMSSEKPFNCGTCGKKFRLSSTLCRHRIIHTSQRPHKCYLCHKSFNRSSTLKTHLRTHNEKKEFVCKVCGKGFHQKGNLRNHTLIHTGEKPYQCRVCSKSFNKLSNLKFHMHCHTDQKPYRCRFCKVSMTRRGELKHHISTYHSGMVDTTH